MSAGWIFQSNGGFSVCELSSGGLKTSSTDRTEYAIFHTTVASNGVPRWSDAGSRNIERAVVGSRRGVEVGEDVQSMLGGVHLNIPCQTEPGGPVSVETGLRMKEGCGVLLLMPCALRAIASQVGNEIVFGAE